MRTERQAFDAWLTRTDWTLHEDAIAAVDDIEGLSKGPRSVHNSQLRAVVNTAKVCSDPGTFRWFINKRAERRSKAGQENKAAFWQALSSRIDHVKNEHVPAAETAVEQATGADCTLSDADVMRIVRSYMGHLIAHCHLRATQP